MQQHAPGLAIIAGGNGDDERDFLRPPATALPTLIFMTLTTQDRIVHLDASVVLAGLFGTRHYGGQLLAHEPRAVPF